MNTARHWFCPGCKGVFALPLVRVQDWNGKCLVCGNTEGLVVAGDVNPNAPNVAALHEAMQAKLRSLGWDGPKADRAVRVALRSAAGRMDPWKKAGP